MALPGDGVLPLIPVLRKQRTIKAVTQRNPVSKNQTKPDRQGQGMWLTGVCTAGSRFGVLSPAATQQQTNISRHIPSS